MPRSVRIEYAGAIYHVMARGNRRQEIFLSDQDREMFLITTISRFGTRSGINYCCAQLLIGMKPPLGCLGIARERV